MTERRWNSGWRGRWRSRAFWRRSRRLAWAVAVAGVLAQVAAAAAANNPDAIAVIVGNTEYRNAPWNVPTAAADARAVAEFAERRLGFDEDRVFIVDDATGNDLSQWFGNRDHPQGKLHDLVQAGRSDVLVFYAGHGMPDVDSKRGYLLPTDADPDRIVLSGYPIDLLLKNLEALPARSVLVALDACFSGLVEGGSLTGGRGWIKYSPPPVQRARMAVLTAASGHQVAYTDRASGHGVFTAQLLNGLGGAADRSGDGKVTLGELETWLVPAVSRRVREINGKEQTPTVDGDGAMVLAALPPNTLTPNTLTIRAEQPGAWVRVAGAAAYHDGMPLGRGSHEVTVEAQGYETFRRELDVEGPTEYQIDLCRVESRTEQICEDVEITRTETKMRENEKEIRTKVSVSIAGRNWEDAQSQGYSSREIENFFCHDDDVVRDSAMKKARREMRKRMKKARECGALYVDDCNCYFSFATSFYSTCRLEVQADCTFESEEEVEYTELEQVCRDEPRQRVCRPQVERLR